MGDLWTGGLMDFMGVSGAAKMPLMDVLVGIKSNGHVKGDK